MAQSTIALDNQPSPVHPCLSWKECRQHREGAYCIAVHEKRAVRKRRERSIEDVRLWRKHSQYRSHSKFEPCANSGSKGFGVSLGLTPTQPGQVVSRAGGDQTTPTRDRTRWCPERTFHSQSPAPRRWRNVARLLVRNPASTCCGPSNCKREEGPFQDIGHSLSRARE